MVIIAVLAPMVCCNTLRLFWKLPVASKQGNEESLYF
jgi:hypothetical protein